MGALRSLAVAQALAMAAAFAPRSPMFMSSPSTEAALVSSKLSQGRVAGVRIGSPDPERLLSFYGKLGMQASGQAVSFGPADGFACVSVAKGGEAQGDGLRAVVLCFPEIQAVAEAAEGAGGQVLAKTEEKKIGPSMIPDEDVEFSMNVTVGLVTDPDGNAVRLVQQNRKDGLFGVSLRVHNLEKAVEFYEGVLGMKTIRKRSNLPDEASISAFLAYGDADEGEEGAFVVELKYEYSEPEVNAGDVLQGIIITTTDVDGAVAAAKAYVENNAETAVSVSSEGGKGVIKDLDGYVIEIVDAESYVKEDA
eukprot:scaffold2626_cov279-Pinguiococcus_pyrenoidosus.AAC.4